MLRKTILSACGLAALVAACSTAGPTLQQIQTDVQAACLAYVPVSNALAKAPTGSSANVTKAYVDGMCSLASPGSITVQGAKALDANTAAWVSAGTAALQSAAILLTPLTPVAAPAAPAK